MVAPATGGGNETVSYTINVNIQQAKKALDDITQGAGTLDEKIAKIKNLIIEWSNSTGNSIDKVAKSFKLLSDGGEKAVAMAAKLAKIETGLTPVSKGLGQAEDAAGGFSNSLGMLGTIGQYVFGAVLGLSAVNVLRNLIQYFKDATQAALEFNQAQVELEIGVRAVQKMGNDTTLQEYYKEIADIQKKYPIFSREQVIEAYSNALVLTRGLKLTKDQFKELIDVSASASIVMGRDFGETATGIAKSLSSGWFEAAQRAGFLISRQSVINEGLALGIENAKRGYNAMTEYERAISALSRYVKENGSIQEDVGAVMESQAGKVKIAVAEWENLQLAIGQAISPFKALGAERAFPVLTQLENVAKGWQIIVTIMIAVNDTLQQFQTYLRQIISNIPILDSYFTNAGKVIRGAFEVPIEMIRGFIELVVFLGKVIVGVAQEGENYLKNIIPDEAIAKTSFLFNLFDKLGNLLSTKRGTKGGIADSFSLQDVWQQALEDAKKFTGLAPLLGDAGEQAGLAFGDGLASGLDSASDAFQKLQYDIQDEATKLNNRIAQLWTDFNRKLTEINADYIKSRARAAEDYANEVANTNISFNNRRADAEAKYRLREIDEEARFQEQMRQLREKFLFDLEDALRERDARQVLRLIRQYQMDKENTTKEADLAQAERKRAFEQELNDIEAQRVERLRLLDEQYKLERQRAFEDWQQKIADALVRYEQEKADAKAASDARIAQQVLDFRRQYNLTKEQADALVRLLNTYFGTNGPVAKIYENLIAYIMALVNIAQTGLAALAGFATQVPNTIPGAGNPTPPPTHAKGGTFLATKPTLAIYGEAGPEMATFTPLGKGSSGMNGAFSGVEKPMPEMGGMLRLMLTLSPDLRTEILNESMYNISTVIEEVNRER